MYKFKTGQIMPFRTNADISVVHTRNDCLKNLADEVYSEINLENNFSVNDELFVNVSHDIRSPLNIIYSAAQLIELYANKDETGEKIAANINIIKQNGFRLMKTLNNILDLQKISVGLFKLEYSYVNIVEVIEEVVVNVADVYKDKLSIVFDTDTEEEYMMVDVGNIARVLLNILSYSLKNLNPEKLNVNLTIKNNTVNIAVTCVEIGSDSAHPENIFKNMDKSATEIEKSSGIGLRLAKLLVETHGGSISYFYKSTKSRTFIIKLPRKKKDNIFTLFNSKIINYDSLEEMIKIEFSDVDI